MRSALSVRRSALGYDTDLNPSHVPAITVRTRADATETDWQSLTGGEEAAVRTQVLDAYRWCATRFPLSILDADFSEQPSIRELQIGRSRQQGKLLSASSPQAPGVVFLAASWPVKSHYRLASLVAHESMHQALYLREAIVPTVRPSSLGYSPWKTSLRPGRWVWHSLWTFTCQFTLLADALLEDRAMLDEDPNMLHFLADMEMRIAICWKSATDFSVLLADEAKRFGKASVNLATLGARLEKMTGYGPARLAAERRVFEEYRKWAISTLEDY